MSKITTPAMERLRKKKKYNVTGVSTPGKEAWKRLKRDRTAIAGLAIIVFLLLVGIFAPIIAPYDYRTQDYSAVLQPPSREHWFGTDNTGRDIFSRVVYGTRYSLPIGILCVIGGLMIGGGFRGCGSLFWRPG